MTSGGENTGKIMRYWVINTKGLRGDGEGRGEAGEGQVLVDDARKFKANSASSTTATPSIMSHPPLLAVLRPVHAVRRCTLLAAGSILAFVATLPIRLGRAAWVRQTLGAGPFGLPAWLRLLLMGEDIKLNAV